MAFDFFIIKHARVNIYELYRPEGIYRFVGGWNWRSFVALLIAIIPNLPGMINAIDATVRPPLSVHLIDNASRINSQEQAGSEANEQIEIGDIRYVYMLSNVTGDVIALIVYYALNRFFPAHGAQVEEAVHDTKVRSETGSESEENMEGAGEKLEGEKEQ